MEWINVNDRMPKETGEQNIVFYTDDNGKKHVCVGIFESAVIRGNKVQRWRDVTWKIMRKNITHWRPLPEPPTE